MKNYKSKYKKFCKGYSKYVHGFRFSEDDDIKEFMISLADDKNHLGQMGYELEEIQNYIETIWEDTKKGKAIIESNILIAEFMGYEKDEVDIVTSMVKWERDEDGNCSHTADWHAICHLNYHKSWKWLLPVIAKCFKTKLPTDDIVDGLMDGDIEKTYNAVIKFIKWLKKK